MLTLTRLLRLRNTVAAAVLRRHSSGGGKRGGGGRAQEVAAWATIYDEAYASQNAANADPSLNFSGYDNSYTPRVPHQAPVVREWVETTVARIERLKPRRALEMGCGQGMIMLRAARFTPELYIACDLSSFSVDYCKDVLERDARFHLPHVRRRHLSMGSLSGGSTRIAAAVLAALLSAARPPAQRVAPSTAAQPSAAGRPLKFR